MIVIKILLDLRLIHHLHGIDLVIAHKHGKIFSSDTKKLHV